MQQNRSVDVSILLDDLKLGRFHLLVFALCFITLFIDGMDFATILVAAPAILGDWQIEQKAMGLVFGAGNLGLLVGTVLFGKIGDRYGRRVGTIAGVITYSLPTLLTGFATDTTTLLILRFLTALGIGGVLPNVIALLNESAPKRLRASFVIAAFIGYSLGAAAVGALAAAVIPRIGWPALFFIVGILGVGLGVILYGLLPESLRYLALSEPDSPRLRRLVASAARGTAIPPDARFHLEREAQKEKVSLALLFRGNLRFATPLLWGAFFLEALTFITLISWTPVILQSGGVSPAMASLAFAYGGIGGIFARLALAKPLDRFGPIATAVGALATIAVFAYFGSFALTETMIIAGIVLAMAVATGTHDSLNGIVGNFYPTEVRSTGIGLASGVGRLAAIPGPIIGGYMLSAQLSFQQINYLLAVPYILLVLFCLMLAQYYRHGGSRVFVVGK